MVRKTPVSPAIMNAGPRRLSLRQGLGIFAVVKVHGRFPSRCASVPYFPPHPGLSLAYEIVNLEPNPMAVGRPYSGGMHRHVDEQS